MGDLIRREEAKAAIRKAFPSLADRVEINSVLNELPSVNIEEKTDAYKQGWHDAIMAALKETHNVYTEDGPFRVVQEETLIGLGMSVSQVSVAEKVGEWVYREELFDDENKPRFVWGCSNCGFSLKSVHDKRNFCPNCGICMKEEGESK